MLPFLKVTWKSLKDIIFSSNPNIMVQFCLKLLYLYSKSKISLDSWAADCQDRNSLQLENIGPNFLKLIVLCLGKLAKTRILVDSLFQNSLHIFSLFQKHFVYDKGY